LTLHKLGILLVQIALTPAQRLLPLGVIWDQLPDGGEVIKYTPAKRDRVVERINGMHAYLVSLFLKTRP